MTMMQEQSRRKLLKTAAKAAVGMVAFIPAAKVLGSNVLVAHAETCSPETYYVYDHTDCNTPGQCNIFGIAANDVVDWYKLYNTIDDSFCGWAASHCCFDGCGSQPYKPWSQHPYQTC